MSGKFVRILFALCFSALFISHAVSADDATYKIAYQFKPGQFSHYERADEAELVTQMPNNQAKAVHKSVFMRSFRVISVDETGSAILEPMMETVRMASQAGDKAPVNYDSAKDEIPPPGFEGLASTLRRPLARFQVAANGRLLKVTMLVNDAPKELVEAAKKTDPSINFMVVLPDGPVKIGDKWSEKFETQVLISEKLNQPISLIRNYELANVENNIATISVRTNLLTPVNDPTILRQLVEQTPSGKIEFDLQQGRVVSKSLVIDEKVVGAFGAQTMLSAEGKIIEKLVVPNAPPKVSSGTPNTLPK